MKQLGRLALLVALGGEACLALTPAEVLVVGNARSPVSRSIVEYYARRRAIPAGQVLYLDLAAEEEIERSVYDRAIAAPIAQFLTRMKWQDRILAIVTTTGVPLKIKGTEGLNGTAASVDSELAALYLDLKGMPHQIAGPLENPYHRRDVPFHHPEFRMYMVTRLTGYTFADVKAAVDRALSARNQGVVVVDKRSGGIDNDGEYWLHRTVSMLKRGRAAIEETPEVIRGVKQVIGYASWGSNDRGRRERDTGLEFLPGALVTEFVSTDGRTFQEPPASWTLGTWGKPETYYAGSPQSMCGDYLRQGATGVSGHVYEPFLAFCPRPDHLFPAYLSGRTLAESFYSSLPALSWMNVVVGDPLTRLEP